MTPAEALRVVKEQTIPALRGSGGDGHADALAVVVAEVERLRDGLRTYEESEAMYQQEKREHAQTRCDLDAKDHEVARLRAQLRESEGRVLEVDRMFQAEFPDWETVRPDEGVPLRLFLLRRMKAEVERLRGLIEAAGREGDPLDAHFDAVRAIEAEARLLGRQDRQSPDLVGALREKTLEVERLRAALYAEAWALDTMHRVAQACMEPTRTSIDGESRARWPQAKRELEKARELADPIFAALVQADWLPKEDAVRMRGDRRDAPFGKPSDGER